MTKANVSNTQGKEITRIEAIDAFVTLAQKSEQKSDVKFHINEELSIIVATFNDKSLESVLLDMTKPSEQTQQYAMLHGAKQKLSDHIAKSRDPLTGASVPLKTKRALLDEMAIRIESDEWFTERESNGGLLLEALTRKYPNHTREKLQAYLSGKSDKQKAALRVEFSSLIEEIRKEKGLQAPKVDTSELLSELDSLE